MPVWINPTEELINLSKLELREILIKKLKKFGIEKIKKVKKYDSQVLFSYNGRNYTGFLGADNKIRIYRTSGDSDGKDVKLQNKLNTLDAEGAKKVIEQLRKTSIKFPKKKLKLEDVLNEEDLSKMSAKDIYQAGKEWKSFDYKRGLEELIKKDKDGEYIYLAGKDWKTFDYKKGFEELIKKDKDGYYIYQAGKDWKSFDFKRGFEELVKRNEDGFYIYYAGRHWKSFDYKRGFEELIKKDEDGNCIYLAGKYWKSFDYKKGINSLKNTEYYKMAIEDWPKGIEGIKKITKQIRDTSIKLPKKKLRLKEWLKNYSQ